MHSIKLLGAIGLIPGWFSDFPIEGACGRSSRRFNKFYASAF